MPTLRRCGLVFILLLIATGACADPALWKIQRNGATVYLFGTVHALPPNARWHYPQLDDALKSSDALYLEIIDDDQGTMQALVTQYGLDPEHPLSGELSAADEARLQAAAQTAGLPAQALDAMKPWLAGLTLTVAPLLKAGYDPQSGADKSLQNEFAAAGKPVRGLETAQQQIELLADLPQPLAIEFLRSTLDDYSDAVNLIDALVRDWQSGDVAGLAKLEDDELRGKSPQLYRQLLVERNQRWAQRIAQMLNSHQTVFIAVGAAHLAGGDDVQAQLQKAGIVATRVH